MGGIKMNRLERITKTVEVRQLNWYGRDDVVYLLSIIEQADKALDNIVNYDDGIIRINDEIAQLADIYEDIAKSALKAIREG